MAKGIPGSSHTRYQLSAVRKDTMASKFHGTKAKPVDKLTKGDHYDKPKGKKGC